MTKKTKNRILLLFATILLFLNSSLVFAKEPLTFTVSEDGEMIGGEGDEISVTGSEIVITQGKTSIIAQKLIYNTKTKVARAFGDCIIRNDNMTVFSKEVFYDTEKNYAKLTGSVNLIQKREQKELTIDADLVELWTESKDVKAEGNIVINDTEKTLYGDTLEFEDSTGIAKLYGQIKLIEDDRTLNSPEGALEANIDLGTYKVTGEIEFVTQVK